MYLVVNKPYGSFAKTSLKWICWLKVVTALLSPCRWVKSWCWWWSRPGRRLLCPVLCPWAIRCSSCRDSYSSRSRGVKPPPHRSHHTSDRFVMLPVLTCTLLTIKILCWHQWFLKKPSIHGTFSFHISGKSFLSLLKCPTHLLLCRWFCCGGSCRWRPAPGQRLRLESSSSCSRTLNSCSISHCWSNTSKSWSSALNHIKTPPVSLKTQDMCNQEIFLCFHNVCKAEEWFSLTFTLKLKSCHLLILMLFQDFLDFPFATDDKRRNSEECSCCSFPYNEREQSLQAP